jgi:hypothetical protein
VDLDSVIEFKRDVYDKALNELHPIIDKSLTLGLGH